MIDCFKLSESSYLLFNLQAVDSTEAMFQLRDTDLIDVEANGQQTSGL